MSRRSDCLNLKKEGRRFMTFTTMLSTMADGMGKTLMIFFCTLIGSLPLGMVVALLRKSRFKFIRGFISGYISIMRGTPLMLQLLAWYFGPYYLFGWNIGHWRFPALIIGFVVNYAAYFAEIFRAGIQSIPVGQTEAATVLGYTKVQTFLKIIFPQMIKRTIPPVTNEVITLVKDTSLSFVLAYQEMFTYAKQVSAAMSSLMPLFVAGVFYYIFNLVVTIVMDRIEKALSYYN